MKLFICNRSIDNYQADKVINALHTAADQAIAVAVERNHSSNWKTIVEQRFTTCDFVVFILGDETFASEQMKWEYSKAKMLNKQIIGYKISSASVDSILYCQGYPVFDDDSHCIAYMKKTYEDDRKLQFDQYKMMVSSTEKVTESRLKVNNIFFTVTSSILSIAFVVGKTYSFTIAACVAMITLTVMAFLVSFFWAKLIKSYGLLNKGKFVIIDKIEKQLRTNMFEVEWQVLTRELKYEPNSKTEIAVINSFRAFILIAVFAELCYLSWLLFPNQIQTILQK